MQVGLLSSSLRRRILASVVLGLGLILLLFGLVAIWTVEESTEAAYLERVTLARALVSRVDNVLGYALGTLEREAASLTIEPGKALTDEQERYLADLRPEVGTYAIVSVTDAHGRSVWIDPTDSGSLIGNPHGHPGVQRVLETRKPQVAEFVALSGDKVFACLAVPLLNREGGLVGVLMAEIDPGHPGLNMLPAEAIGQGMQIQIIDEAGRLLIGGNGHGEAAALQHRQILASSIASRAPGYRIHEVAPTAHFPSHLVAYAPSAMLPAWGVVVEQPKDVVLAAPRELQLRLILLGFAGLLVAAAVAWFDVRRVVRPLQQLTLTAERFAGGQFDEPVRLNRSDELGVLASTFEAMRRQLRASLTEVAELNRDLEQRVAARTAEVEDRNREMAQLYQSLRARDRERAELLQRCMAGHEEERRRLAQELHDDTSQALASLRLGLERLASGLTEPEDARRSAVRLQEIAAGALAAVHHLAVELRPSVLDDLGLVAAIDRYVHECATRWGLKVDFATVGVEHVRLIPAAETGVYRIVQAAITNVVQHASAQRLSVLLEVRDAKMIFIVEDDGRGFDLDAVREAPLERRLGLAGMEERAYLVGADLTIETAPGSGTTVFLEVPVNLNVRREDDDSEVEGAASR